MAAHRLEQAVVALRDFARERFPPRATVPIAALLYAAPASLGHPARIEAVTGAMATFLGLLCLRIADDVVDRERDRALHPQRGLPSGRIDRVRLLDANLALWTALVALESTSAWRLMLFLGACAFYRAWFSYFRARVHSVARPFLSNLVFPLAVFHGAGPGAWRPAALLALYAWLAAVAHEFGHNVGSGNARVSAALFALAALAAALLWLALGQPRSFGVALLAAAMSLGFFLARRLRDPGPQRARTFYRAGILFALVPALGLLLSR
jgi:4-hydroxybenzoate polyprenyltransferase